MNRLVLLAGLLVASSAAAESPKAEAGFGIAVNNPMMWRENESVGVSLYYRFARKQVIRINFARYSLAGTPVEHAMGFVREGFLDPPDHTGRMTDLGVGWMYFPRRAFDGPSIELGAVWRDDDRYRSTRRISHDEVARALVGWSWLMHEHLFVAVAAGGAVGTAEGTVGSGVGGDFSTWTASFEGYVRFGLVFGN